MNDAERGTGEDSFLAVAASSPRPGRRRPSPSLSRRRRRLPRPAWPVTASGAYRPPGLRLRWRASPTSSPSINSVFMRDGQRQPGVMAGIVKTLDRREHPRPRRLPRRLSPPPPFAKAEPVDADKAERRSWALGAAPTATRTIFPARARPGDWPASGRLPDQVPEGLPLRRAARPRHGRDDGGVGHAAGRGHRPDRPLSGGQALDTFFETPTSSSKPLPRRPAMAWKTPRIVEIAVGMEITPTRLPTCNRGCSVAAR